MCGIVGYIGSKQAYPILIKGLKRLEYRGYDSAGVPAFVGMLFSCSEVKTDAKKLEGKWNIVEVKGEKILKEGLPNMEFDMKDNKVHGNAGCNIFNSTVVLDDQDISSITINPAATTMMACSMYGRIFGF